MRKSIIPATFFSWENNKAVEELSTLEANDYRITVGSYYMGKITGKPCLYIQGKELKTFYLNKKIIENEELVAEVYLSECGKFEIHLLND